MFREGTGLDGWLAKCFCCQPFWQNLQATMWRSTKASGVLCMMAAGSAPCHLKKLDFGSLSKRKAQRIVSEAAQLQVWPTRIQFIEALAALSSLHAGGMHHKLEGSKTTVAKMLHFLASLESGVALQLLAVSSRLAVSCSHAPTIWDNSQWSFACRIKQLLSTNSKHAPQHFVSETEHSLGKLMSHNLALFSPTARQMPGAHVLARRLGKPVWTKDTWLAWVEDGRKNGESLLYKKRRLEEQRLTSRKSPAKRPACVKKTRKRTVFTLPRDGNVRIRRGGVKAKPVSGRQNQVGKEMTVDVSIPMFDHCSKVCSTLTHGVFGPNASKPLCEW